MRNDMKWLVAVTVVSGVVSIGFILGLAWLILKIAKHIFGG